MTKTEKLLRELIALPSVNPAFKRSMATRRPGRMAACEDECEGESQPILLFFWMQSGVEAGRSILSSIPPTCEMIM